VAHVGTVAQQGGGGRKGLQHPLVVYIQVVVV